MMTDRYFFTRGVHACWLDRTVIFLNVTDDSYDCLAGLRPTCSLRSRRLAEP